MMSTIIIIFFIFTTVIIILSRAKQRNKISPPRTGIRNSCPCVEL